MGGLGALASMGMMGGGEKLCIQRRTGTAMSEGSNQTIMFALKEAGMLNFESSSVSMDVLKAFATEFPIATLDDASCGDRGTLEVSLSGIPESASEDAESSMDRCIDRHIETRPDITKRRSAQEFQAKKKPH